MKSAKEILCIIIIIISLLSLNQRVMTSGPQTEARGPDTARRHIWPGPLNNTRDTLWFIFSVWPRKSSTSRCQIERNTGEKVR